MGILIVHCPNRPEDEMIDCGAYGIYMNMHSHNVDALSDDVLIGVSLDKGKKLPLYSGNEKEDAEKIAAVKAQIVGAVVSTKKSGILSTDPPGGAVVETAKPVAEAEAPTKTKASENKSSQTGGGE